MMDWGIRRTYLPFLVQKSLKIEPSFLGENLNQLGEFRL